MAREAGWTRAASAVARQPARLPSRRWCGRSYQPKRRAADRLHIDQDWGRYAYGRTRSTSSR
jgi:hypothetical protein